MRSCMRDCIIRSFPLRTRRGAYHLEAQAPHRDGVTLDLPDAGGARNHLAPTYGRRAVY